MPRKPREVSKSGIYHITIKGINKQLIFYEDADRRFFLNRLKKLKDESGFQVFSWCLMDNHIHLVIRTIELSISKVMQRINGTYSMYMNQKYEGSGTIYEGRFYSSPVENISYLHTVIRYTHQNPVRSSLVENPSDYQWSSCRCFYGLASHCPGLTDTAGVLKYYSDDPSQSTRRFIEYTEVAYDLPEKPPSKIPKYTDAQAVEIIQSICTNTDLTHIKKLPPVKRNPIIKQLKNTRKFSSTQLARVLGIPKTIIWKV
ncbi:REP-associated tyrosine transposase [Jeotgalibacillus malaysiensis]|uniref:REP-associated tyrosine transposase n=1 Tax=Jeotgalibacillus malaysiensis TaxID=1508404 RepID=UPI00384FDEC5